jgi:pimeloyl-ACP methyl ester carboxylesterase
MRRREEQAAANLDDQKVLETSEWGLDALDLPTDAADPHAAVLAYARQAIDNSQEFFSLPFVPEFTLKDNHLTFSSALETPEPENRLVHGTYFPVQKRKRAVILLGHWNAPAQEYDRLGTALARSGTAALRMSMPYHDERKPADWPIARDLACANVGRTIRANRQAVLDTRATIEFLLQEGYHRIGIAGASVGGSVGMVAAAHDERVGALFSFHIASHFGAVLYRGRATRHIRQSLGAEMGLAECIAVWDVISPIPYLAGFTGRSIKMLFFSGRYDRVFHPSLARELMDAFRSQGLEPDWRVLPCGHFTMGMFPFSTYVGAAAVRFFKRSLERGVSARART